MLDTKRQFTITIVGRPNAGKSTLFNKLCKENKAIVAKIPGVTRDFQMETIYWKNRAFNLVDTSGYDIKRNDLMQSLIDTQYEKILDDSDAYLFLCDGQAPISQLDLDLLDKIRKRNRPTIRVVNKMDTTYFQKNEAEFFEFYGDTYEKISSEQGRGLSRLLKRIASQVGLPKEEKPVSPHITSVVIMGRPNVGKSTLMNQLLKKERVIVSPIPGTTRDPVDSMLQVGDQLYRFIDTAGLRKRSKVNEKVESLSTRKAIVSLEKADIMLLVIDAVCGPTDQDIKISNLAWDRGVGIILLINKWDLLPIEQRDNGYWQKIIANKFRSFDKLPFLFVSALEKRNVSKIFDVVRESRRMHERVVKSEELSEQFQQWVVMTRPPLIRVAGRNKSKRVHLKLFSCKQIDHAAPTFEIRTNLPQQVPAAYDQFLKSRLRETFGFWGIPITIKYSRIH